MISETPLSGDDPLDALSAAQKVRLGQLIDTYERRRDRGNDISAEELCVDDPELLTALRISLHRLSTVEQRLRILDGAGAPEWIGEFRVLEQIGSGGSGVVFRCRQTNPDREVAVKVLKPTLDAEEQRRRFRREIRVCATLEAADIADVYVTGITDWHGVRCFWIAMKLIDGGTLTEYFSRGKHTRQEKLRLFRQLCLTMQSAHRQGVVHRDLKPRNVLVSQAGVPHFVDFGVSAILSAPGRELTTDSIAIVGTAAWMAPEVLTGEVAVADTRADIYSLGVILFQLISGQHPLGDGNTSVEHVAYKLRNTPITRLSSVGEEVSRDLNALTGRMIERDPEYRYQNMDDVVQDLDRLLIGQPVRVRLLSRTEVVWRWCRRHSLVAGLVTAVMVMLAIGLGYVAWSWNEMVALDLELVEKNASLRAQKEKLTRTLAVQQRTSVSARLSAMQQEIWQSPIQSARRLHRDDIFPPHLRGLAWQLLSHQSDAELVTIQAHERSVRSVQFGGNNSVIAAISATGLLRVLAVPSGSLIKEHPQCQPQSKICFSPDGRFVFAALQGTGIAAIPVADTDAAKILAPETDCNGHLALSDDGKTLVALTKQRNLLAIDVESGEAVVNETPPDLKPMGIWFQNSNRDVGAVTRKGLWTTWSLDSFRETPRLNLRHVRPDFSGVKDAVFTSALTDGHGIALRRGMNIALHVRLTPQAVPSSIDSITMLREDIESLEFAPPDSLLVVGHRHTCLRNLYGAEFDRVFHEPDTATTCCSVAETGEYFAVGCHDGSIRIRRVRPKSGMQQVLNPAIAPSRHELGMPIRTAVSPKGRVTVVGFRTGWVSCIDSISGETISRSRVGESGVTSLVLDAGESWLAVAVGTKNHDGVVIYSADWFRGGRDSNAVESDDSPEPMASVPLAGVRKLCRSDDGRHLFAGLLSGEIAVIDTKSWTVENRWQGHDGGIYAIDTHGDMLVSGGSDGSVRCWNSGTGEFVREWEAHSLRISDLKIRSRDSRIYTASFDETTAIWNLDGELQFRLNGHSGAVRSLDVAPDGETLATASDDFTIRLWDAITGDAQLILRQHTDVVRHVLFHDDRLISTSQDGTIRVWGKAPATSKDSVVTETVATD